MRKSIITFLSCLSLIVAVASCTTSKQTAITRLERFSYDLRDNGQYYSFKDWERAADEFTKIRKSIGKHDLTGDERHYVGELEGQCAGYVYNGLKGRVQNFGSELNGILQGLLDLISRGFEEIPSFCSPFLGFFLFVRRFACPVAPFALERERPPSHRPGARRRWCERCC